MILDDMDPNQPPNSEKVLRILLVDDEDGILEVHKEFLDDMGFETVTASNGSEALSVLATTNIDLVLSDITMPVMDGIQLLKSINRLYPKGPPVIFISGGTTINKKEASDMGARAFLTKPMDEKETLRVIKRVVQNYKKKEKTENPFLNL